MNKKGFTLIELLIVIAIIGILASVVIVSLGDQTEKAEKARIQSELAQLSTIAILYREEREDRTKGYSDFCGEGRNEAKLSIFDSQGIIETIAGTDNRLYKERDRYKGGCHSSDSNWVVWVSYAGDSRAKAKWVCVDSARGVVVSSPNTAANTFVQSKFSMAQVVSCKGLGIM